MTINDVDVSGCQFLDEYKHCDICKELCEGHCLVVEDIECKTYEDCYYKQLQRVKRDNINIKKAFNDILLEILEMQPYDGEIRADGNTPLVVIQNYKKEHRQYKQTLQEIKAIAEENKFYFVEGTIIRYETIKQIVTNFEKILDLITKAESDG